MTYLHDNKKKKIVENASICVLVNWCNTIPVSEVDVVDTLNKKLDNSRKDDNVVVNFSLIFSITCLHDGLIPGPTRPI